MKKSIQDLKESLRKKEQKQQRLHEQEDKIEKDIRVLRYLIEREEQAASAQAPRKRKIARKQVSDFFTRIALFYEDLQRRLDLRITYRCFCRWLCTTTSSSHATATATNCRLARYWGILKGKGVGKLHQSTYIVGNAYGLLSILFF